MCIILYTPPQKCPPSFWLKGVKIEAGKKIEASSEIAGLAKRDFPGIEVVSGEPSLPPPPATSTQLRMVRRAVDLGKVAIHAVLPELPPALSEKALKAFNLGDKNLIAAIEKGELDADGPSVALCAYLMGRTAVVEAMNARIQGA